MVESNEASVTSSQRNIIFKLPGYDGPLPDFSDRQPDEVLFTRGGASIVRLSPTLVAKFGAKVTVSEAESLTFVNEKAPLVPTPVIYACYTIGPFCRDVEDFGDIYDTYIIMSYVKGQSLNEVWADLNADSKLAIATQLKLYMQQLRAIHRGDEVGIGSVNRRPVTDLLFENHEDKGSFNSEQEFDTALVSLYERNMPKVHLRHHLEGALAQHRHTIVFTHGDFRSSNIMVDGDSVTGIVDWEMCGWYPEYWEYVKSFSVWGWPQDWPDFISSILQSYHCEWLIYDLIKRNIW